MRLRRLWSTGKEFGGKGPSLFAVCVRNGCAARYVTQFWRFWNAAFIRTITGGARTAVQPAHGDRRFKDDAWQETPYYDLLKQSYPLASKQLHELVDHAQVDDRTRLQFRFCARQFIEPHAAHHHARLHPTPAT
jgi:polyhydroxyalkanoate synthase